MKRFTASSMRRTTDGVNRKQYRKNVIYMYRGILKEIRWYANQGNSQVDFRLFDIRADFDKFHAFRLFAYKHPDFIIRWTIGYPRRMSELTDEVVRAHCSYDKRMERVGVTIKW